MADSMSVDKREHEREHSEDSLESTPEPELGEEAPQEAAAQQKRKGGRKPIYATSEERKQRNRQAQAAFRERRTEYIKQLEDAIRVHETNLHNLQTAHRSAADECLMLRYKNSLLERILLEKGIDVQAELQAKTGSPHLGPAHIPHGMAQPTVQRAIMNRHQQARRTNPHIAPKIEPGALHQSPQSRPTPSSHASSPASNSPGFLNPGVMTPPASDVQMQHQQQYRFQAPKMQPIHRMPANTGMLGNSGLGGTSAGPKGHGSSGMGSTGGTQVAAAYYPSPTLQSHYEQLEQEYDAQADMIDDQDPSESGPGPYPESFAAHQQSNQMNSQQQLRQPQHGLQQIGDAPQATQGPQGYQSMSQLMDSYDPMLDMDPFGLSASMQFPTQFSFDTNPM